MPSAGLGLFGMPSDDDTGSVKRWLLVGAALAIAVALLGLIGQLREWWNDG